MNPEINPHMNSQLIFDKSIVIAKKKKKKDLTSHQVEKLTWRGS